MPKFYFTVEVIFRLHQSIVQSNLFILVNFLTYIFHYVSKMWAVITSFVCLWTHTYSFTERLFPVKFSLTETAAYYLINWDYLDTVDEVLWKLYLVVFLLNNTVKMMQSNSEKKWKKKLLKIEFVR